MFSATDVISVAVDVPIALSSPLCVDVRQPYSGLIVRGKNSTTKSVKTCSFIAALDKKFISDCLSSTTYLESRPNMSAFD